jgi:hypothetical protein
MAYISFQPSDHFNTKLYTGTGSAPNAQTGVGFKPDLLWIKTRSTGNDHRIHSPLLTGSDYFLHANADNAQTQNTNSVTSFDTDGFTLGNTDAGWNGSGVTFVSWNWKANGQGSSNTDGSINTTYTSANTTAGFSIVKYTGTGSNATIGHGLGAVPKMIMVKNLTNANAWSVYHASLGATKYLALNETDAAGTASDRWQDTTPTSSVFSIGTNANQGGSYNYIAYCFAPVKGFSAMGSYTGNGNADGTFVYTGFKPAFVIIKNISATESWYILDNKRPSYNTNNYYLLANTSGAEGTSTSLATSLLSNGFKIENSDTSMNTSGQTYIYMCFAESPIVSSNGIPAVAR